jgi:hypothetical protein
VDQPNPAFAAHNVSTFFEGVSKVWKDGASIGMLLYPDVRTIDDPFPPQNSAIVGIGRLGDVEQEYRGIFAPVSEESDAVVAACNTAWIDTDTGVEPPGITLVFVRELLLRNTSTAGGFSNLAGFSPPLDALYDHGKNFRLCKKPYNVISSDVASRWAIVRTLDRNDLNARTDGTLVSTTAHELGHVLLLGHGDGLDDDKNGSWDSQCDSNEYLTIDELLGLTNPQGDRNIMNGYVLAKEISSLQKELARAAAKCILLAKQPQIVSKVGGVSCDVSL